MYPKGAEVLFIPHWIFWMISLLSLGFFLRTIQKRIVPLRQAQKDPRFNHWRLRILGLLKDGFLQIRQPRYPFSGVVHLVIFWGFVVLGLRSLQLIFYGLGIPFINPFSTEGIWHFYAQLKDIFEVLVLIACVLSIIRRAVLMPSRYKGSHQFEAYLVLSLISFLMITDIALDVSHFALKNTPIETISSKITAGLFKAFSASQLRSVFNISFLLHLLTFFVFLNILPVSKHFHIITALPNVLFKKLAKGSIKPARYGIEELEDLEYLGIRKITDFTWKHILDFYSCTECGRCSDNCPANLSGRALSPKILTLKLREHLYSTYPVFRRPTQDSQIVGEIVGEEEIWSCTTCGACERECPVFIEYIDKIVDMRRYLVEQGENPSTFNQIFLNMEKTGNPFGRPGQKRTEWLLNLEGIQVRILKKGEEVDTLFFVDSYPSFDPRSQLIASAVAKGLSMAQVDFGILGPLERDSGHQVRRMGEEGLFQLLKEQNQKTFEAIKFQRIVTTDPHSFNTLKNDYQLKVPVYHYSEYFLELFKTGRLSKKGVPKGGRYTYHDPCYLGRHNGIYEAPREILEEILGVKLVEMKRSREKSFCCGGADVSLWHEVKEEERMAQKRIGMALEVGADRIVTACPFCLMHLEDAIKTMGLEGKIQVLDLMELIISVC